MKVLASLVTVAAFCSTASAQEYLGQAVCANCHRHFPEEGFYDGYLRSGHPWKLYHNAGQPPSPALWPWTPPPPLPIVYDTQLEWTDVEYVIGNFFWKTRFVDLDGYIYTGDADETTQWNIADQQWVPYHAGELDKPFNCGRCHTTGYEPEGNQGGLPGLTGTWVYEGVKCEACHGPGSDHANSFGAIPTSGGKECADCHYRDDQFRMPWKGGFMRHHQQSEDLAHSAHKNVLTCEGCHNPHRSVVYDDGGTTTTCESCHAGNSQNNFYVVAGMESVQCTDCHMPDMAKSAAASNQYTGDVRGHLFRIMTEPIAAADNVYDVGGSLFWNQDANGDSSITLDYACLGCHLDIGSPLTLEEASAFATNIHGSAVTNTNPDAFNVIFGAYMGGMVEDLYLSDDVYVRIEQRPAFAVTFPLIELQVDATAPSDDPAELIVRIEAASSAIPNQPPQKLSLRDYEAAAWEIVDERIATLGDSVAEVTIDTNTGRFIEDGTNQMKMQLTWFDPGNVFSPAWTVRIDQAIWQVIP